MDFDSDQEKLDQEKLDQEKSEKYSNHLQFVKPLENVTKYKRDQKELLNKAIEISRGDKLGALKYIVSSLSHEDHDVEFILVLNILGLYNHDGIGINLPIITQKPSKDIEHKLGFYVIWGDGIITHNETYHKYSRIDPKNGSEFEIRIFGLNITGFENVHPNHFKAYLRKVVSFGNLGHKFTSLESAFDSCRRLESIPSNIPSSVTNLSYMFNNNYTFNLPIETWDTKNVTDMSYMFSGCTEFNQPIEKWDTRNVTNMSYMFSGCIDFNQPLNKWATSNVTDMRGMFSGCISFDQPLNSWDTKNITDMSEMFDDCRKFNQPLDSWDTSNVTNMSDMFGSCHSFNQPLDSWDTGSITNMSVMFSSCEIFNQPLNSWNTSSVIDMSNMFINCVAFDQPLDKWDVSNVNNMNYMFSCCFSFSHPLNSWDIRKVEHIDNMFLGCAESTNFVSVNQSNIKSITLKKEWNYNP